MLEGKTDLTMYTKNKGKNCNAVGTRQKYEF